MIELLLKWDSFEEVNELLNGFSNTTLMELKKAMDGLCFMIILTIKNVFFGCCH